MPNELTIKQIEEIAFAVLRSHNDDRLWRALTYESGPYDVTNATLALQDIASAFFRAGLASAPAAQPSAQGEAVAPFLFVAMDDDKRAHLTWCADEAAVREAVKGAMFFVPAGEELSAEHTEQLDGSVEELLESGALIFEGDPPLYLYRVASAPAAPAQAVPLTDEHVNAVVRSVQPYLSTDCKAWRELTETCRYWLQAERGIKAAP